MNPGFSREELFGAYTERSLLLETPMTKLKPSRDIQPVTEFRANAAQFIEQVQVTGEPVILTQHGKSAAVLLDVASYETMVEELALLRDVRTSEDQIAVGKTVAHSAVARRLRARLKA
jgi:antitoxin YefM